MRYAGTLDFQGVLVFAGGGIFGGSVSRVAKLNSIEFHSLYNFLTLPAERLCCLQRAVGGASAGGATDAPGGL